MVNKIIKLLSALLLVFTSLYILSHNQTPVDFQLSPNRVFSMSLGVMVISVFVLGFLVAAMFAGLFRLKGMWYERKLEKREATRLAFLEDLLKARAYIAGGEWGAALQAWKKVVKKDPTHMVGYVELSRCHEQLGDQKEALRVLERARAEDKANIELLFRAAELNLANGNQTAAIDNLTMILKQEPMIRAASMAFSTCEELGRYDDALAYLQQAIDGGMPEREAQPHLERLKYRKLVADHAASERNTGEEDAKGLRDKIKKFLKKHPDCQEALVRLGRLEIQLGTIDKGAEHLVKVGRLSGEQQYWNEAISAWLSNDLATNALGAAKTATRRTSGHERMLAELDLIRLNILLTHLEAAREHIDGFAKLAELEGVPLTEDLTSQLNALDGLCHHQRGEYREAALTWQKITQLETFLGAPAQAANSAKTSARAPIAPQLSTP